MPKGFDTTADCTHKAQQIKAGGYDFVGRYLSSHSWKVISPDEANALRRAGLAIVLVYEDGPTADSYFSHGRGYADATRAAQQADLLGAPGGTTIYFAVDYDAAPHAIDGVIAQYFRGVVAALKSFAAGNNPKYEVGVYGSGATCGAITASGLASRGWLADATGWRGHASYTGWSITQSLPIKLLGMSVDPDSALDNYGAIPPMPADAPVVAAAGSAD
jgi:hypothetical protein